MSEAVNPDAHNPRYPNAPPLCEVIPNMRCLLVAPEYGHVHRIVFTSEWSQSARIGQFLSAQANGSSEIDLCEHGIHPYPDGSWETRHFAIRNTEENVEALHVWLSMNGYVRADDALCSYFPRLGTCLDGAFWNDLGKHLKDDT